MPLARSQNKQRNSSEEILILSLETFSRTFSDCLPPVRGKTASFPTTLFTLGGILSHIPVSGTTVRVLAPIHLFSATSFSSRSCCIFSSICRRLQCSSQMGLCSLLGLDGGWSWLSFSSSISSICCFSRESSLKKCRDCEYQPSLTFSAPVPAWLLPTESLPHSVKNSSS